MTKASKTAIILTTTLVIVGVGGYLVYTYLIKPAKNKKDSNVDKATKSDSTTNSSNSETLSKGDSPQIIKAKSSDTPTTQADIINFQNWLNKNHAGWATGYTGGVVNSGDSGYGSFGTLTQAAWNLYKDEYISQKQLDALNRFSIQDVVTVRNSIYGVKKRKYIGNKYVESNDVVNLINGDSFWIAGKTFHNGKAVYVFAPHNRTDSFFFSNGDNLVNL